MRRIRDRGLTVAMFSAFLVFLALRAVAGPAHPQRGSRRGGPAGSGLPAVPRLRTPARGATALSPWPVRVGGLALVVYRDSLSTALLLVFGGSFLLHLHLLRDLAVAALTKHDKPRK